MTPSTDGKKNVLKKIDEYVALEAKRKETVGTIEKLIKFTKSKKNCFLCKQTADSSVLQKMDSNFPVENQRHKYDGMLRSARVDLEN